MVALAKPLKRTPVSGVEFLQKVRALIEDEEEDFICLAIHTVGRKFGTPEQIVTMVERVRDAIRPHSYYSTWAAMNRQVASDTEPGWQRRGRLALIDRFIKEAQDGQT